MRTERRVVITVPPATETGSRIRLRGQGAAGAGGAPAGDIIITFQVQPDRFFRRDGLDIICEVPINMVQAAVGTRLRVRTLDGKKVMLRIPPGTQPGRKFRIKGQGIERNAHRGDQLVQVQVTIPERLTEEQQEQLKKFAETAGLQVYGRNYLVPLPPTFGASPAPPRGWGAGAAGSCRPAGGPTPGGCPAT